MTALTILWNTFAVIGLLSVVGSLGWFVFTWRTTASGQHDPTPADAEPSNVRVIDPSLALAAGVTWGRFPRRRCETCGVSEPHDACELDDVIAHATPRDAGSTTLGHALGVVVVLGGLLLLLAVAGAIEGGGL